MPRMPGTLWRPAEFTQVRMSRYDIFCIHTIVGFAPAQAAHFSTTADGDIIQSRDTLFRSAANLDGNHRVVASENEDHGSRFGAWDTRNGHAVPAFTPEQVKANSEIALWLHDEHGIPLELCPNSRPESRGLAYHRQGIDGNFGDYKYPGRVSGGEVWTKHFGKVCPGDRRIAQREDILELALNQGDDEVTPEDIEKIATAVQRIMLMGQTDAPEGRYLGSTLSNIQNRTVRIEAAVKALSDDMSESVQIAVKDALADSVIDVDINVNDRSETP
jgi:hypothetical protein